MAPPPPVLGDGDEPLGTGVLGDVGGGSAARSITGNVTCTAHTNGRFHHAFRGGGEDRHEVDRRRRRARRREAKREYERYVARVAEAERKRAAEPARAEAKSREIDKIKQDAKRRAWEKVAFSPERQEAIARAAKLAELEQIGRIIQAANQERLLARDDEDIAVLLLAA